MGERHRKDINELESELLELEPSTRAALAKTLLASLENLSAKDYERLWAEEAEARYADFLAGRTNAVDGDDVFARAYSRVRAR
ncbi:MAG: addiction module protein [Acidobacteria bacterium]|nr:addiction module protein [Acidobacteriota bacterium]